MKSSRTFLLIAPPLAALGLFLSLISCMPKQPVAELISASPENTGTPVVVLQSGLGDDNTVWKQLLPGLTPDFITIALNRPGYGAIPATDTPRDPCSIAAEQRRYLQAAGVRPPYILVGHSLGGLYQYVYARLYPDEVAGFVLLDPTHPRNWEVLQKTAPELATLVTAIKTVSFGSVSKREFDAQTTCLDTLDQEPPLPGPGKILVSGRLGPLAANSAYRQEQDALHNDWARLTGIPQVETVWDSGHYIQREVPSDVVAAIRQVAGKALERQFQQADPPAPQSVFLDSAKLQPIIAGITTGEQLRAARGEPAEQLGPEGHRIWVYHDRFLQTPPVVSLIPVLGDILDTAEVARELLVPRHELIIQLDAQNVVTRFRQRKMD